MRPLVKLKITIVCLLLYGCGIKPFSSAAPPMRFEFYEKDGASVDDIKKQEMKCGFSNFAFRARSESLNDIARQESCMLENGFRFRSKFGYYGVCKISPEKIEQCRGPTRER